MHYTGTIWRPPYEAWSALLQVTAGCTHHSCKFCTLYKDLPFKFRMSPMSEIEADLQEISRSAPNVSRLFLTGANPFVLEVSKLKEIARLAKQCLQKLTSIGCFARITDITPKSVSDLKDLRALGYNKITIGVETGDDAALSFMNKGYTSADILEQCHKLDVANIEYDIFYLTGIYGKGNSENGVAKTLKVFNQINPKLIGASMLTIYPTSELYSEIQDGRWTEESEIEKYEEMKLLICGLEIKTVFAAMGASNLLRLQGNIPDDKELLISQIDNFIGTLGEQNLRNYRTNLKHL